MKYWDGLHSSVKGLSQTGRGVNVVVGPARNTPSPSIFVIVSACDDQTASLENCPVASLDFQSFLLPTNSRYSQSCLDIDVFLRQHVATLRDIENHTGLRFFPELSYEDKTDLLSRTPLATMLLVNPDPSP